MPTPPVFRLRNVSCCFESVEAITGLNLEIGRGEKIALVGPSGAGKSTLIRLLNGSLAPTQGDVEVFGRSLAPLSARQRRPIQRQIGTLYQQFHLVNNLAVIHNINAGRLGSWSLFKALVSLIWPLETQIAAKTLARVGIPEKLYERTATLSGGQQQRVAIARVLVQNPDVILADEPIASIDPERSREVMNLLRDLSGKEKTLIVSLHAIEYAFSHFDRIVGLRTGRLLFDAVPSEVTQAMIQALYRLT
ncbi:MAG: phosphonate ABC transporter ATP-binding protein [Bellilinea sp.]